MIYYTRNGNGGIAYGGGESIYRAETLEAAIADMQKWAGDFDVIGTEPAEFGDFWNRLSDNLDEYDLRKLADEIDPTLSIEDALCIRRRGSHPGGYGTWIDPRVPVLAPVYAEIDDEDE